MCGIAGHYSWGAPLTREPLEKSAQRLSHRGPDDHDIFLRGHVGLVHTRLSIIDLAGGHQPLHSDDDRMHLVANGEVYNYVEVNAALGRDYPARTGSDCEAIMQVYAAKGLEGIADLNGMFAFALHDEAGGCLILCRDRLGIKPLFYAETDSGLVFASELKALLPMLDHVPEIQSSALAQFLQCQFSTGRDTIFKGVKRVLPGEMLVVCEGRVQRRSYWDINAVEPRDLSLQEAIEAFDPLFETVMKEHMRADVPFGLFLSGGIDSSVLLAELAREHSQPLRTFSVGYAGTAMADELSTAEALAKHFGTRHTSLKVTRDQLFRRIVHSIWANDDLMRDYACLPTAMLSQAAARELKVVFSGEGGDEAFAGYRRFAPSMENRLKSWLMPGGGLRTRGQWSRRRARRVFGGCLVDASWRDELIQIWRDTPGRWSRMQRAQVLDIRTALADNLLVKADRTMMAFGLEGRVPFADHRVIEFGLSLPDKVKYQQGRGKWLVREWARTHLPTGHLQAPKRGFYVPVNEWLSGDFLKRLGQKLATNAAVNAWFRPEGVRQLVAEQQAGGNASRELWGVMQFAIWHRLFVEGVDRPPAVEEDPLDWL